MSSICSALHKLLNGIERFKFPFDSNRIPQNGIYVLFELGEKAHNLDKIVRVGTHTGNNQLPSRLKQHFINENKDRSVFRKNIGRALLAKSRDPFLKQWNIDLTTRKAKEKYGKQIDFNKQREIERQVTEYIQDRFSFIVFPVKEKAKRLELESKIISTVSRCDECRPSENWLGLYSPIAKIRESGLWLTNELYKVPLSEADFDDLKELISNC
jgi:hypothetical protein